MFATRAYFSLSEITDPMKHRDHNEWHQLDHRPENLLLPGVAWGDRWVRSPDCAALSSGSAAAYMSAHYGIMYWFREPLGETLDDWFHLTYRSFQWGRSPQIGWTRRPMRGLFAPVKGYVAPRVRVSVDALPYRPVKAVQVTLSSFDYGHSDAATILRWYDEVRLPDLLQCRGVAGGYVLAAESAFRPPWEEKGAEWAFPDTATRAGSPSPDRMLILYLDEEPDVFYSDLSERDRLAGRNGRLIDSSAVEDVLFSSPFRRVVPWQWDWFDGRKD
jgi:hypothetical protein